MKAELTYQEIFEDLKSRGEYNIRYDNEYCIWLSNHGKSTLNVWAVNDGELKCIDCRTIDRQMI